jgi:hypothetical protein
MSRFAATIETNIGETLMVTPSPGLGATHENMDPKTWTFVPFGMSRLELVDSDAVPNPADPILPDQILTQDVFRQWTARVEEDIREDDGGKFYDSSKRGMRWPNHFDLTPDGDCACPRVTVRTELAAGPFVPLPKIEGSSAPDAVNARDLQLLLYHLWLQKQLNGDMGQPEKIYTLLMGRKIESRN